jgi:hypothetical protein
LGPAVADAAADAEDNKKAGVDVKVEDAPATPKDDEAGDDDAMDQTPDEV